jgi:DNA-binding NtrC family response regulator
MHSALTQQLRRESEPRPTLRLSVIDGPDRGKQAGPSDATLTVGTAESSTLALSDPTVSRFHCEFSAADGGARVLDLRSTNGTFVGAVRVGDAVVPLGTVVRVGQSAIELVSDAPKRVALHEGESLAGLVGRSTAMRSIMEQLAQVAPSMASVLVTGESGTGKELVAEALHRLSPRAKAPFVVVDCASLVPTLVASELFGHEKGAFTGADRAHVGAFERARGGTLFLDEIGELPPSLQPSLLGALERKRVRRLGARTDTEIDVRVVCATNRDLRSSVNDGSFRLDLYYRIAVVSLRLPALRERPEDVPALIEHFLRAMGHSAPIEELFSPAVLATLRAHRWPGNVRELRNVIEAAVAFGDAQRALPSREGSQQAASAGEGAVWSAPAASDPLPKYKDARAQVLAQFERAYCEALVVRAGGNVSLAARTAGLDRGYVSELLARHQIERA